MCLYTTYILNPKYLPNKKNGHQPPVCTDERLRYVPVSCGGCIECRKKKKREWSIRLNEELKKNSKALFVTLTFNDQSLDYIRKKLKIKENPSYNELNTICYYAVRHFIELIRPYNNGKYPKYWLITELGEDFERIHLHGLMWTTRKMVNKWRYGYFYIGEYVNAKTINYITKYVLKMPEKNPNFIGKIMASKGIGAGYWKTFNARRNRYQENSTNEMYLLENGTEIPLPQYYRNYLYTDREKEKIWIEKQERGYRYIGGEKVFMDDEEGWNNLTRYYQQINERIWHFSKEDWDKEIQRKRIERMLKARKMNKCSKPGK